MIVDLHSHLAMQVRPSGGAGGWRGVGGLLHDRWRHALVSAAGRFGNLDRTTGRPRVSVALLREGGVRVALSPLYSPLDEMIVSPRWHLRELGNRGRRYHWAPPGRRAFPRLLRQLESVERHVAKRADEAVIVRDGDGLKRALREHRLAVVHCVEGGFHVSHAASVDQAVAELARRGVAYITLGHLFFKSVATVAPAWATLEQQRWHRLWPQPDVGLTPAGRAVVRAMLGHGVLIDLSHLSAAATQETFALLDELDPARTTPVLASHVALRFAGQEYNLDARTVEQIAARGGVVGLIASGAHLADGTTSPRSFDDTMELLFRQIDRLHSLTGSHRTAAIGTDLAGFITPAPGLESAGRLHTVEKALIDRYGVDDAALITADNALRMLRARWGDESEASPPERCA